MNQIPTNEPVHTKTLFIQLLLVWQGFWIDRKHPAITKLTGRVIYLELVMLLPYLKEGAFTAPLIEFWMTWLVLFRALLDWTRGNRQNGWDGRNHRTCIQSSIQLKKTQSSRPRWIKRPLGPPTNQGLLYKNTRFISFFDRPEQPKNTKLASQGMNFSFYLTAARL